VRVIRVTAKAGPDGCFHLKLSLDSPDQIYDVAVVIAEQLPEGRKPTSEELGWPAGYFEQTYGSIQDEAFTAPERRPPKPIEPLDAQ
jgi:hypothetical protein